jgi:hypothetical protein
MQQLETSPSALLATKIVKSLVEKGLIPAGKRDDLTSKIGTGRVTVSEWKLFLELALPSPAPGATNEEPN